MTWLFIQVGYQSYFVTYHYVYLMIITSKMLITYSTPVVTMEMSSNSTQKDQQKKQNVLSPSIGGGFVLGTSVWVVKEIILCTGQLVKF